MEALPPGAFMLWIGLAAIANAVLLLVDAAVDRMAAGDVLACSRRCRVLVGRKIYGAKDIVATDAPFLNRRADALVGRETRLHAADREWRRGWRRSTTRCGACPALNCRRARA